jgi:cyclophilin family peptidyl-prolyl cis-trans isomerase/DNA-binding beta-propeller fold protein YncE
MFLARRFLNVKQKELVKMTKSHLKFLIMLLCVPFLSVSSATAQEGYPNIFVSPASFTDAPKTLSAFGAPGVFPIGLAYDGEYFWNTDPGDKKIYQLDTAGNIISSFDAPGDWSFGLAYDGEYLWVSEITAQKIYKLDISGNVQDSFPSPQGTCWGLAYDGTYLWVSATEHQKIYQMDTSGNVIGSFASPGDDPTGLAYDGEYLWVTDTQSRRIYQTDASGNVISVFDSPVQAPYGLAYDGESLWIADDYTDKIYRVNPSVPTTKVGESRKRTFTVTNLGTEALVIGTLSLSGKDVAEFAIEKDMCSGQQIAPSETAAVDIVFSPESAGGKVAALEIPSNDPDTRVRHISLSGVGQGLGYLADPELWIRAVIHTEDAGDIEAVWQKGGQDTTDRGDKVIWGHFYANPDDVSWGYPQNPDLFVKIWFDVDGRVDVNFFHVSVPDIEVYSDYLPDEQPYQSGVTTMERRYIRQYYKDGETGMDENDEDGIAAQGYSPERNPRGCPTLNDLRIGAVIKTEEKGYVEGQWHLGGTGITERGDQVFWGHFYASPSDVAWGSENNPDLFVKIWFDIDGRIDVNFFHVSVPEIEVYSALPDDGIYDNKGTAIMADRYIRHEYSREPVAQYETVKLETDYGDILIWLYDQTPLHKANFLKLVKEGFYDGLTFHRIINNFMIQGGDPSGDGTGGPGYTIAPEIQSELTHVYGAVAAARKSDVVNPEKKSSGSQFYIVEDPAGEHGLDMNYTVFGQVFDGMDAVESIAEVPTDENDRPLDPVYIQKAAVMLFSADQLSEDYGFVIP